MKFLEEAEKVGKEILEGSPFSAILARALDRAHMTGRSEEQTRIIELAKRYLPLDVIRLFIDKVEEELL